MSEEIKSIRAYLKLTQVEFALLLNVHPITVSKWERESSDCKPNAYQIALMRQLKVPRSFDVAQSIVCQGAVTTLIALLIH